MDWFFRSGLAVDLVLAIVVAEAFALWLFHRRTGKGPSFSAVAPFLAAGACLLLALRAALVGAPWYCMAAALALSGVAHVIDLTRRFRA